MTQTTGPGFEAYLTSKRIDSEAFRNAEPEVWQSWKADFEQMHPNSFTVQKLNLINPIRRKYQLKVAPPPAPAPSPSAEAAPAKTAPSIPVAKPGRPIIKPKLKPD